MLWQAPGMTDLSELAGGDFDLNVRDAAMEYVEILAEQSGGTVTRDQLEHFTVGGRQIKLIDQSRGIRNPAELAATISVVHNPLGPYDDQIADGFLSYSISTAGWRQGDNRKLHTAYQQRLPIIVLQKLRANVYVPSLPAYLVDEHPERGEYGQYLIAFGEVARSMDPDSEVERRYAKKMVRHRLHQPLFRAMVLEAYVRHCAICSLKHVELLDAAHIVPDSYERGRAAISNGLALCKIHHSAYDADVIGIDADYRIHIAESVMQEVDGPMLRHGLQDFHGELLRQLPSRTSDRPSKDALSTRFKGFLRRSA